MHILNSEFFYNCANGKAKEEFFADCPPFQALDSGGAQYFRTHLFRKGKS
jgi:hypothetical protein